MKTFKLSLLALSLTALAGCKAIDAMDNTETMKTDLAAMKSTTGGMAETTNGMKATTEELERKAAVDAGLKRIEDPANQKEFAPPSKGLLAGAKLVAENMTSVELTKFYVAALKEIRKTIPAEIEQDRTAIGGYPARFVFEFNRKKEVQIVTLQAIAAQIPQKMIEKIVQEQLQGPGGAQADETKDLLVLRAMFLNNFFLSETMFATGKKLDNVGKLRSTMDYIRQLHFVADELKSLDHAFVVGEGVFLPPVLVSEKLPTDQACIDNPRAPECNPTLGEARTYAEKVDPTVAKPWYSKVAKRIDKDMPDNLRGGASPYAHEIAQTKEECLRQSVEQD